jgi:hypothetical protein
MEVAITNEAVSRTSRILIWLALGWVSAVAGHGADGVSPTVASVEPEPGTIYELSSITVTFSEPVTNVVVTDLLLNGQSTALAVEGSNDVYTFTFAQQPPYGPIQVRWDPGHDIRDLDDQPPLRMDENAPGNTWAYTLVDVTPPTVTRLTPAAGSTLRQVSQIEVLFSEPVAGVDAGDLLVNGAAATNVSVQGVGRYLFQFAPPSAGAVTVQWAGGHGIRDFAVPANTLGGGTWSYTLDPGAGLPSVRINEFLASNVSGIQDEDAEAADWIELWNYGDSSVELAGFSLTDDINDPGKWAFPATNLGPGQFLVVFASGKDRRAPALSSLRFHTNFKLNRFGNYLALFNNESPRVALTEFAPEYPEQRNDYSYGYDPAGALRYFSPPTPGASNAVSSITGLAPKPHLNVERGVFAQPFTLIASSLLPGATLRYTTDGSEPTATHQPYTAPLVISNTTVFRIAAFAPNTLPSRTETHTYLFADQVLRQPNNPPGFPAGPTVFTGYPSDYEMDPEIVTNAPSSVKASLLSLPVLSIGIKNDDMFGPVNGIYTHPEPPDAQRDLWERACSAEYFLTNGQTGFQVDCGVRIQGNASRTPQKTPKHPFRLMFRGAYGPGRLEYPVFPDAAVASFDTLVLRADFNNSWLHWDPTQRIHGSKVRDVWTKESFRDMNGLSGHTRHFHLYINGLYWGVYDFGERIDAEFAATYLGGVAADYDAITSKPTEAIDGDLTAYNQMTSIGRSSDMRQLTNYTRLQQHLDLPTFIDYMLLNFYGANQDWGFDGNWNAVRRRNPAGTFRYVPWDGEQLIVDVNNNRVTSTDLPSGLHTNLVNSLEYRLAFADRAHKHLFNSGALTPENSAARWMKWAYEVEPGMVGESARWGDYRRDVHPYSSAPYYLYTTNGYWWPEINRMPTSYFPQRGDIFLQQLRSAGLYPNVAAPAFSQHGGRVGRGFALSMTATNPIYYTTDGTDPREYGTGTVSGDARAYTNGVSVVLTVSTVVKARALSGTNWSALNEASFAVETLTPLLRVTEIMYNPLGGDTYEFLELQNAGDTSLEVGGWSFSGITFIFPIGTVLAPGQVIVLGSSLAPANWTNRYSGVTAFGRFDGSLSNGGEKLSLKNADGEVIYSVDYNDENGWPTTPDGQGYSLEVIDPLGDPDDPANWRASAALSGTPGAVTPPPATGPVLINEIMANNLGAATNGGTVPDWIELHNSGEQEVNVSGWSLTDSGNPRKFVLPADTTISGGGFLVVWCDDATNTTPGLHAGFGLDNDGESVFLYDASTSRVDAVTFGLQLPDFTVGRIAGAWTLNVPTLGATNEAVSNLGSTTNLALNEWLADAPPGLDDWVELFNRSTSGPIALRGIYLTVSNAVCRVDSLSFIAPGGFAVFQADGQPGPNHLDFNLEASGGTVVLYDETATERDRAVYGVQIEGVTQGRLPDGAGNTVSFPGTASPGAPNYQRLFTGATINEVMAVNQRAVTNLHGVTADWIELVNTNDYDFELVGYRLSTDPDDPNQWYFPSSVIVPAGGYLVVWFDDSRPPSYAEEPALNTGRPIKGESGGVYLFNPSGVIVDSVVHGFQVADLSIGLSEGQWQLLAAPTPGGANSAPAVLAGPAGLRLNEWMANPLAGDDWFELFNGADQPVQLSGLFLSDDPSSLGLRKFELGPLSYIAPGGFVKVIADDEPGKGLDHANYALDAAGETLTIFNPVSGLIDTIYFGQQAADVSEGRLPDGALSFASFPTTPTPAESNYLPLPNAVINEVLSHPTNGLEQAIEIYNPTPSGVSLGGWFLSASVGDLKQFRIPGDTFLPGGGYAVFYQAQFGAQLALDAAHGGEVVLSEADAAGNLSGRRAQVRMGASAAGVSWGRFESCAGTEFVALSTRSFGVDQPASPAEFRTGAGLPNTYPTVGPVVISELMYHPPDLNGLDNSGDEYVELHNLGAEAMPLFDPAHPASTWRLRDGVDFDFPPNVTLPAGSFLLVVNFSPLLDPAKLAAFRSLYSVPTNVPIVGPYGGKLANDGERVELQRPEAPVAGGFVPYLLADAVRYSDLPPWPVGGDGDGASLQRLVASEYGSDPANWMPAGPTAGQPNPAQPATVPVITAQPVSRFVDTNSDVVFSAATCGNQPTAYRWFFDGQPLAAGTNSSLRLTNVQPAHAGEYHVVVSNGAGSVTSAPARLDLMALPVITVQPQGLAAYVATEVTLSVTAEGPPPLSYQWRYQGGLIPGATNATLILTNVQSAHAGDYSALVGNPAGAVASAVARLQVPTPPLLLLQPKGTNVPPGVNVTLSVSATGDGLLRYQWRFNGQPLPDATNSTLVLTNLQLPQSGSYAVLVTDSVGGILSDPAAILVLVRPTFTVQPTNLTVAAGGSVTFFTAATGTLPMSFRWLRSGTTFTNGILINTPTNSTLIVTNVPPAYDRSPFRAAAKNVVTELGSAQATLTVIAPPVITNQPVSITTPPGTNATFAVGVWGVVPMGYTWWFNRAPLTGRTNSTLTITNVQARDSGFYSVVVTNRDGMAASQAALLKLPDQAVLSAPAAMPEGGFQLSLEGTPNLTYAIDTSTNLVDWAFLKTIECTDGRLTITDPTATNAVSRFYRARPAQ